jgi:addiction module RelB/DinJ family antitoxin
MKTVINIKTDRKLKMEAQKVAKEAGIPLSLVVNNSLREFVSRRAVTIQAPLVPNAKTAKILSESIKDIKAGRNIEGPFYTVEEFMKGLKN